jgi:RNA polymerase sigma-70 factor (ECF subfamily)
MSEAARWQRTGPGGHWKSSASHVSIALLPAQSLHQTLLDHLPEAVRDAARARAEDRAVATRLAELVDQARHAWPALAQRIADQDFVAYLAQRAPGGMPKGASQDAAGDAAERAPADGGEGDDTDGSDGSDIGAWLARVQAADLYLAHACARGDETALRAFEAQCGPDIESALRRVRTGGDVLDDARQILRQRLFVGTRQSGPRIAAYSGRGPLRLWLRVTVVRIVFEILERESREPQADENEILALPAPADDPEIGYLKQLYQREFKEAFEAAVAALADRERTLLMQYHVDGLTIDELGALYRVHRVTAARWVARARKSLHDATRKELQRKLDLSPTEFDRLLRTIWSHLDISIYRLFGKDTPRS